jgi:uncharacterized membrane protein
MSQIVLSQVPETGPGVLSFTAETMMSLAMKSTLGENLVAVLISGVVAILTAIAGLVGGIFLCNKLFTGEGTESALVVAPVLALLVGTAVFVFAFRKLSKYREGSDSDS